MEGTRRRVWKQDQIGTTCVWRSCGGDDDDNNGSSYEMTIGGRLRGMEELSLLRHCAALKFPAWPTTDCR